MRGSAAPETGPPVPDSRGAGETEVGPGEDTAPHHLPRTVTDELPGDTLVAGKKTASAARSGRDRTGRKPADPAE
ncbi:hypothetical protein GCM10020219_021970 [Nonomuraea dietziae]